jgi:hypothetical protein
MRHRPGDRERIGLRHNGRVDSVAQLLIYGSGGTAAHVTASLGVAPTRCAEAGDPVRPGSSKIAENSRWFLDSDEEGSGVEVCDSLRTLLDLIEPKAQSLWQLDNEGYFVVWRCVAATNDLEHDIEIDRETLLRLVALPGVLRLDVYDDGSLTPMPGTPDR